MVHLSNFLYSPASVSLKQSNSIEKLNGRTQWRNSMEKLHRETLSRSLWSQFISQTAASHENAWCIDSSATQPSERSTENPDLRSKISPIFDHIGVCLNSAVRRTACLRVLLASVNIIKKFICFKLDTSTPASGLLIYLGFFFIFVQIIAIVYLLHLGPVYQAGRTQ